MMPKTSCLNQSFTITLLVSHLLDRLTCAICAMGSVLTIGGLLECRVWRGSRLGPVVGLHLRTINGNTNRSVRLKPSAQFWTHTNHQNKVIKFFFWETQLLGYSAGQHNP